MMEIRKIQIVEADMEKFKKKYQKEIDILIFGCAFEDEQGKRLDPRLVLYDVGEKEYKWVDDVFEKPNTRKQSNTNKPNNGKRLNGK